MNASFAANRQQANNTPCCYCWSIALATFCLFRSVSSYFWQTQWSACAVQLWQHTTQLSWKKKDKIQFNILVLLNKEAGSELCQLCRKAVATSLGKLWNSYHQTGCADWRGWSTLFASPWFLRGSSNYKQRRDPILVASGVILMKAPRALWSYRFVSSVSFATWENKKDLIHVSYTVQ